MLGVLLYHLQFYEETPPHTYLCMTAFLLSFSFTVKHPLQILFNCPLLHRNITKPWFCFVKIHFLITSLRYLFSKFVQCLSLSPHIIAPGREYRRKSSPLLNGAFHHHLIFSQVRFSSVHYSTICWQIPCQYNKPPTIGIVQFTTIQLPNSWSEISFKENIYF